MAVQKEIHFQNKENENVIPPGETLICRLSDLPAAPLVFYVIYGFKAFSLHLNLFIHLFHFLSFCIIFM